MGCIQSLHQGKNYVATSFVPKGQVDLIAEGSVNAGIVEEDVTKATQVEVVAGGEEVIEKTPSSFDRSKAPVPGPDPSVTLPVIWKAEAANGMKVFGIEQHELPLLTYNIVITGGHMLDDISKPGVARFTAQMMNEGTKNKTPEELEEAIQLLGANISIISGDENITVSVSTLARNFEKTLAIVEEMLLEPRWDEEQFSINKTRTINNLKRNLADPNYVSNITLNKLVLGADNIHSTDNSGTVESVEAITMDDLKSYYEKNISPSVANFLIVGDVDQARVEKALSGLNEKWTAKEVAMPALTFLPAPEKSAVYFVDIPGAKQSVINIGAPSLPRSHPDFYKADVANFMLGEASVQGCLWFSGKRRDSPTVPTPASGAGKTTEYFMPMRLCEPMPPWSQWSCSGTSWSSTGQASRRRLSTSRRDHCSRGMP
jgi:zinc protease